VYGQPVEILAAEEGGAYGAALLAGVGSGAWPSVDEACGAAVRVSAQIEPEKTNAQLMDDQYQRYRAIYPALKVVSGAQP
jgi:xylulokinase